MFPICRNEIGHPIRIDSSLLPGILEYQGNHGLKGALDLLNVKPVKVYVEDEGAITDADTKEDYHHLVEIHNARLMRPQINVCLAGKKSFFRTRNGNFAETHRVPGFGQGGVPEDGHFL